MSLLIASLIAMIATGILGLLAGWAAGNLIGYDTGYDEGRRLVGRADWEASRENWGQRGDMGQVE